MQTGCPSTVVVINDDPTQLALFGGLLEKAGFDAQTFTSAESALQMLSRAPAPALLITDLYMPGIDGWRLCRLLRSTDYSRLNQIPILVTSATFSGCEPAALTAGLGANAFLPVPASGPKFLELVKTLVAGGIPAQTSQVLIVEDDPDLLLLLEQQFRTRGYAVETAGNCAEAMAKCEVHVPELLVLDYHLPDRPGDGFLVEFCRRFPASASIMITGDPRPELAVEWLNKGAGAYVLKPFEPEYILHLSEHIRRERALLGVREVLEQRTRQLQEARRLESLALLAGGLAHDFNNLLLIIQGNAALAGEELPPRSRGSHNLQEIDKACRRAADLCAQMLAYSGQTQLCAEEVDLTELVEGMLPLLRSYASRKATLRFELKPGLPRTHADAVQICQIVSNLVVNGLEALSENGGTVTVGTGVSHCSRAELRGVLPEAELPEGSYVWLEVADNGCGMEDQIQSRIFEPFFTTKFLGRGVGLSAVLGIVRAHHGALQVRSSPGNGSSFRVLLPTVKLRSVSPLPALPVQPGL